MLILTCFYSTNTERCSVIPDFLLIICYVMIDLEATDRLTPLLVFNYAFINATKN